MPKASRGGRRASVQVNISPSTPRTYSTLSDSEAQTLRDLWDSQYDANTTSAIKMYISYKGNYASNFDGKGYSMSQTMNYLLDMGVDLSTLTPNQAKKLGLNLDVDKIASMDYADRYMMKGFHKIGKDIELQRGAHDDMLRNVFGIQNYSNLTESQLKKTLIGEQFTTKSHMSTSYDMNKNPFLGQGSGVSGGREVIYKIKAKSDTMMLFGNKRQSEIILSKNTNYKITNVYYSKDKNGNQIIATPRNSGSKKQIVIEMEVV